MKRATAILLATIGVLYVLAIFVPVDPVEARPGTRLTGSDVVEESVDWSFITGSKNIDVQTNTWYLIPHSVTTGSWVADGNYYVGCGGCASKRWPKNVARAPDVVLKVEGKLYRQRAILVTDPTEYQSSLSVPLGGEEIPEGTAVYRIDPRDSS